jgi:hypothetical protein
LSGYSFKNKVSVVRSRGNYINLSVYSVIAGLAEQVEFMIRNLGFQPRLYKVPQTPASTSFKYQVRLSRDVAAFLQLVQPLKR